MYDQRIIIQQFYFHKEETEVISSKLLMVRYYVWVLESFPGSQLVLYPTFTHLLPICNMKWRILNEV